MGNETAKKILLVEDESDLTDILTFELERLGYEVNVAGDGLKGLKMFEDFKPDLVVTDIVLPNMNGFVFIRSIQEKQQGIPIIGISGAYGGKLSDYGDKLNLVQSFEKPFSVRELVECITTHCPPSASKAS